MKKILSSRFAPAIIAAVLGIVFATAMLITTSGERRPAPADNGIVSWQEKSTMAESAGAERDVLSYNELLVSMRSPQVRKIELAPGAARLTWRDGSQASSQFPERQLERFALLANRRGIEVDVTSALPGSASAATTILRLMVIAALIAFALFFFAWLRVSGERRGSKRNSGKEEVEKPGQTFADVAGCDEAVQEIAEFVHFIEDPERFERVGAKMPSGAVLYGPPGTGKTLLAKALAGEASVPFFYMAGSDAVNKYVGVGASNIRKLFKHAKSCKEGAVVFIDEIDAIGRARHSNIAASNREYDQTLNQLLVELDGFLPTDRLVVIGATNRLDMLDPALLRPGRLSRHIPVLPPSEEGRRSILQLYSKNKPLASDVNLDALAKITAGSTGAELADMINEAAIQAARENRSEISEADMREGHLRALAGPERSNAPLRPEEKRQIAYHEAGHVLCAELMPEHEKAQRVTIVARGQAAGLAVYGREDRALHSPEYVRQQLVSVLGGRAAERVVFGTVSSGAANDLQQANELARQAIEEWGLSKMTGQLTSRRSQEISDHTRSLVDSEVEQMVADAFRDAVELLEENRQQLQSLAEALLQQENMERVDIIAAIGNLPEHKERPLHPGPSLRPAIRTSKRREEHPAPRSRLVLAAEAVSRFLARRRKRGGKLGA